ncbi:MAG: putative small integral membrane protein [Enterobacterales bacterium]|jgi:predicted small integral membrane protein
MNIDLLILCTVICGYGLWFSLAVLNNIADFQTNRFLIARMISMQEILDDSNLGNGIQWRALKGQHWSPIILTGVIFYQLLAASKLAIAGVALISLVITGGATTTELLFDINIALLMMLALWFGFLTGGLWFGYWIKMPQVQIVHIMLVLVTLICLILVNML